MNKMTNGPFPFPTKWNLPNYFEMIEFSHKEMSCCKKILDIGCGRGESTHFLNAIGIEIRKFVTWNVLDNGCYLVYNGYDFPFKQKSFDGFLLNNVFEHVKDKEKFVRELEEIGTRNAKIIIILPTICWKLINLLNLPKFLIAWIRGYGLGNDYWFVHEPSIYGLNYFKEFKDFLNWEKIVGNVLKIEKIVGMNNRKQKIFVCSFHSA